jgi:hypothetical protein
VWLWNGAGGSWHFITVPPEDAAEIRVHSLLNRGGFGSVKVEATIVDPSTSSGQAVTWRTSVFPQKSGGYLLPVKADVRRRSGIAAGDEVKVELELL